MQLGIQTVWPNVPIILGDAFIKDIYVLFDLEEAEISFAIPNFNETGSNLVSVADIKSSGSGNKH